MATETVTRPTTIPGAPPQEYPAMNPDEVRRPKEFCPDQKSRGAWEIC